MKTTPEKKYDSITAHDTWLGLNNIFGKTLMIKDSGLTLSFLNARFEKKKKEKKRKKRKIKADVLCYGAVRLSVRLSGVNNSCARHN